MEQFKVSRAIGLSFKAWFRNFIPFTLLLAVLQSPVVIWVVTSSLDDSKAGTRLVDNFFVYPVYLMAAMSTLVPPLLTYRVIQELNGTKVSMWTSIRFGVRGVVPAILFAALTNAVQQIPVAGSIIGAILTCVFFVVTPAAVAERLGPIAAFKRSEVLTQGRRWGIFGLTFLFGLIFVGLLAIWIVPMFSRPHDTAMESLRTTSLFFIVAIAMMQMLLGIAAAVSYALLRQDKDGVTHAELAKIFE